MGYVRLPGAISKRLGLRIHRDIEAHVYNHESAQRLAAMLEGADYARRSMVGAAAFRSKEEVFRHSIAHATGDGLVAEFGVWSGQTINAIADHMGSAVTVHGFDSFEGLPEDWFGSYRKGTFHTQGRLPEVRANVKLHVGWFDATVPAFAAEHPEEPVRFLHVDCDLYSSTRIVFDHLGDRLAPGSVILFDEYFNYPGWTEHEHKAFQELVARRSLNYRYLAYNTHEFNAAVQIIA